LATRLLDWTYSPFVALHFATENTEEEGEDGAVWAVNFSKVHEFFPGKLKKKLGDAYIFPEFCVNLWVIAEK